jgi:hypothetical protein
MTTAVLASSFLAGSLLTMLLPIATISAMVVWGVLLIRRHERRRATVQTVERSTAGAEAGDRSRSALGD